MPKTWSIALKASAAKTTTTWARCVLITRTRDNLQLAMTAHDQTLTIDGIDYLPKNAFSASDIASFSNMDADNMNVSGLKTATTITDDELRAGRWDYFYFEAFRVNWADLSQGKDKLRAGHLGPMTMHNQEFEAELIGLLEAYGTSIGEQTSPGCRASLGDARCKVDLDGSPSFTVTGTITSAETDFFTIFDTSRTEADGYFDEGIIEFVGPSGHDLVGLSYAIKAYVLADVVTGDPVLVTKTPLAYDATGAEYVMTAGCNRTFAMCRDRFANYKNFRGEPNLKGQDKMLQVGRKE